MQLGPNQQHNTLVEKLISAINENDCDVVRDCIEHGVDPNMLLGYQDYQIFYGCKEYDSKPKVPLLHIVACKGQLDIAELLLQKGADLHGIGNDVLDLLFTAIRANHAGLLRRLIDLGVDIEIKDLFGTTPLLRAIYSGNADMIEILIAGGAEVNARSKSGETPLHHARNVETAELLLNHSAQVDAQNKSGETPLHHARNAEIAELLLNHGAEVNARSKSGETPLHHAINAEIAEIVELLLNHGAQVDARDERGDTPLHLAKKAELAELLLNHGAQINVRNNDGDTPLHRVIHLNNADLIKMMIARGAEVNATNLDGERPLSYRIFWPDNISVDSVKALLRNGANPHLYDEQGEYALTAYMSGKTNIFRSYQSEIVVAFIEAGGDINQPLLHYAARENDLIVMSALFQKGAKLDGTDQKGQTALHYAVCAKLNVCFSEENAITFLINNGANINFKDNDGNTPLHHMLAQKEAHFNSLWYKKSEIYDFIIKGASIHSMNKNGISPYMLADKDIQTEMKSAFVHYNSIVCKELAKMIVTKCHQIKKSSGSSGYMTPLINSFMSNITSVFTSLKSSRAMRLSDFDTFYGLNSKELEQHVYGILINVPLHVMEACNIHGNCDSNRLSKTNLMARIVAGIEDDKPLVTAVESAVLNQCGPLVLGFELANVGLPKEIAFEISQFIPEYATSAPKNAMFMTGFEYVQEQASKKRKPHEKINMLNDGDSSYEAEEAKRPRKKARLH